MIVLLLAVLGAASPPVDIEALGGSAALCSEAKNNICLVGKFGNEAHCLYIAAVFQESPIWAGYRLVCRSQS
jgi:hypothetical protein